MNGEWIVFATSERVELNAQNEGVATFTVTNHDTAPDIVVLDPVPGDGVNRSWFSVERPQRRIEAGASATYLVRIIIPAGTPAGSFWMQARIYSADTSPDEGSQLSGRVTFDAHPSTKPTVTWWPYLVAGVLLVAVLGVVGWLMFGGSDTKKKDDGIHLGPIPHFSIPVSPTATSPTPNPTKRWIIPHFNFTTKPIRSETLIVQEDHYVNLEKAATASGSKGDIAYHFVFTNSHPLGAKGLEAEGQAQMVYLGVVAKPNLKTCTDVDSPGNPVVVEDMKTGGVLCVLTNAGHMAVVTILDMDVPGKQFFDPHGVKFYYDLYATA
jgi:hypothetical protein